VKITAYTYADAVEPSGAVICGQRPCRKHKEQFWFCGDIHTEKSCCCLYVDQTLPPAKGQVKRATLPYATKSYGELLLNGKIFPEQGSSVLM
jgi:hypothetical protein